MVDNLDLDQRMAGLKQSVEELNPGPPLPLTENRAKILVKRGDITVEEAHATLAEGRQSKIKPFLISRNKPR